MKRKFLVILFFIVVFGFPISWYLILQTFGENQFDLPVIRKAPENCEEYNNYVATLSVDSMLLVSNFNLNKRVTKKLEGIELKVNLIHNYDCLLDSRIMLIDSVGMVRGEFELTREDIDRLFAELDIYALNIMRKRS